MTERDAAAQRLAESSVGVPAEGGAGIGRRKRWGRGTTLKDVADAAGVSLKTASRVLNDDPKVATGTRQLVLQTMESLAYEPDPAARSLRAGRDRTIGIVIDSIGDIFFSELAATIESELDGSGYRCLFASSNREPARERDLVRAFVRRRCAGVIVAPTSPDSIQATDLAGTPVVFVDRHGHVPGAVSVVTDDVGLAREATKHLIRHGHRRIALVSDSLDLRTTRGRHQGYFQAISEAGLEVGPELLRTGCDDESTAMVQVGEVLALPDPATAIFSCSSRLSLGIVPALHQWGRTDVALVSFGDFLMAGSVDPGVSVIDHSAERIGRASVTALLDQLLKRVGTGAADPTVVVPARLVPRGTGELPGPHILNPTDHSSHEGGACSPQRRGAKAPGKRSDGRSPAHE